MPKNREAGVIFSLADDRAELQRTEAWQKKHPGNMVPQVIPIAWECSQCHQQFDQHCVNGMWHYCPVCGRKIEMFDDGQDALW